MKTTALWIVVGMVTAALSVTAGLALGDVVYHHWQTDSQTAAGEWKINSYPNLYAPRTIDEVFAVALADSTYPASIAHYDRWIEHYDNRIAYERAMLDDQGGVKGEQLADKYEVGGRVLRRGSWYVILKVNKRSGIFQSVSVAGHFASTITADEIKDYQPPVEGDTEKVKAATDKGPMCNYPGDGFKHMTTGEWKRKKMSDVPQAIVHAATATHGKHRTRATWDGNWTTVAVYLTDAKRVDPPAPPLIPSKPVKLSKVREDSDAAAMIREAERINAQTQARQEKEAAAAPYTQPGTGIEGRGTGCLSSATLPHTAGACRPNGRRGRHRATTPHFGTERGDRLHCRYAARRHSPS